VSLTRFIRDAQSRFEAIPAVGAIFYNAIVIKILRNPEKRIINDIIERIKRIKIGTILDLGSGTGYLSIEIAKKLSALQVYGIDLSIQMVKIARRHAKAIKNAQFVFGNVANLPFKTDSIDFIISTASLHHWKRPIRVFDECYRVLRSGREAWIYDPCTDALKDDIDNAKNRYGALGYRFLIGISRLHGFSKEEYKNKIRNILDQTLFKNSYQMQLTDIWMKTILTK
jgi:ubiquinone/menaquinone biosynthesis C-methylase UbiE